MKPILIFQRTTDKVALSKDYEEMLRISSGTYDTEVKGKTAMFSTQVKRKYRINAEVDKAWFGRSVVTENGKSGGKPLLVHRGEHGNVADLSTRVGSLTFSDWEAAKTYATEPNDQNDIVKDSRIHHAYLKLENPIFKDPDDPFVDLNVLEAKMGKDFLNLVAKKHGDWITETNAWEENGQDRYEAGGYKSVVEFLNKNPDTLDKLCVQIYPLLDDEELIQKMKAKGYDGAIHGSNADTLDSIEYRIFDKNQIRLVKTERLSSQERVVEAGLSPTLYHWTRIWNAAEILSDKEFSLTESDSTADLKKWFLATTRSRLGGYHIEEPDGVVFVLDGVKLGQKYLGKSYDFYANNPKEREIVEKRNKPHMLDEMEDRVFSKEKHMPVLPYTKEIHVYADWSGGSPHNSLKRVIDYASGLSIPCFVYPDKASWRNMDKRKAEQHPTKLAASVSKFIDGIADEIEDYGQLHSENAKPMKAEAGLSPVLYHWTTVRGALGILEDNSFLLNPIKDEYGSSHPEDEDYYLSTSRSKMGGYHISKAVGVLLVLDGVALRHKYKGKAFDYFHYNPNHKRIDPRTHDEMEDRILSKKPRIENAAQYIKEMHVCSSSETVRRVKYWAEKRRIPLYAHDNSQSWLNLDKRKAEPQRLAASTQFNNWVDLTDEQIKQEYEWEYISHQKRSGFDPWPTLKDFKKAVEGGTVETLTEEKDRKVGNRSRCSDLEDLKDLTSGYRFPRDVDRIVKGFQEDHAMPYPLILEQDNKRWVMSGNTRLDAAFILGVTPKVLVIKVPSLKKMIHARYEIRASSDTLDS